MNDKKKITREQIMGPPTGHRPQARGVCLWRLKRLSLCCAENSSYWLALFIYLFTYFLSFQYSKCFAFPFDFTLHPLAGAAPLRV